MKRINRTAKCKQVDPVGRAIYGLGLQGLHCWDRGFESAECIYVRLLCLLCVV